MTKKKIIPETYRHKIGRKTMTLVEWAEELGLTKVAVHHRINASGWDIVEAYTTHARGGLEVKSTKVSRPHRFEVHHKGNVISTHYRKAHAEAAITTDGRRGLKLVELEKKPTSVEAGFRLTKEDKATIKQGATEANMSFSLFIVTCCLAATERGTYSKA